MNGIDNGSFYWSIILSSGECGYNTAGLRVYVDGCEDETADDRFFIVTLLGRIVGVKTRRQTLGFALLGRIVGVKTRRQTLGLTLLGRIVGVKTRRHT